MKVYQHISLKEFIFWGDARYVAKWITDEQFDYLESIIVDLFENDPIYDETLNDLFSNQANQIANWLGCHDFLELRWLNEKNGHIPSWKYED